MIFEAVVFSLIHRTESCIMNANQMSTVVVLLMGVLLHCQVDGRQAILNSELKQDGVLYAPKGGELRMNCFSNKITINTSRVYRHQLYAVEDGGNMVPVTTEGCERQVYTVDSRDRLTMRTVFRLRTAQAGSQTYACGSLPDDEEPMPISTPFKILLEVRICTEPELHLTKEDSEDGTHNIIFNTKETCGFNGAVKYLVNGVPVPQSGGEVAHSSQAVQHNDSSLEIHSFDCITHKGSHVCDITATFTDVFEGKIRTSVTDEQISDCCISGPLPTEEPEKITLSSILQAANKLRMGTSHGMDTTETMGTTETPLIPDREELELSKLRLEIEVLSLKSKILPLQIGRQKRMRDSSKKSGSGDGQ